MLVEPLGPSWVCYSPASGQTHLLNDESAAVLEMLFREVERDEYKCRFKWRPGSVAFWDNRCTQHLAIWDYHPLRRYGLRVTIAGDVPV